LEIVWREIIGGERLARTETLEHDIQLIMNRAQEARLTIETSIGIIPGPDKRAADPIHCGLDNCHYPVFLDARRDAKDRRREARQ